MITDVQLNMIRFELARIPRKNLERAGIDKVIKQLLKRYNIKNTKQNYNSIKILIDCKK